MTKITQAFIFAAGRGERMRPLTDTIPKPLVKIKGKSIIDYIIEKLDKITSIEKIIINGFYLNEQIEDHIKKLNNPKIIFSKELEKLETGGGLVFAKDKINLNKPLLTINGDILWLENNFSDIEIICNNFNESEHNILLGLKKKDDFSGYEGAGDFNFDQKTGKLNKLEKLDYVFTGIQVINPKILENPPKKCFSMSYFYKNNDFLKKIKGIELLGKYFHIGDVKSIKNTENFL